MGKHLKSIVCGGDGTFVARGPYAIIPIEILLFYD
jgi:hypothetical protein